MSMQFYNLLHMFGLMMLFSGLAGLWGSRVLGGTSHRRFDVSMALVHGFGMLFMLVGGFGMLARMGLVQGLPGWVYVKLGIWFLLGGSMVLAKRRATWGLSLLTLWIALGVLAGYFGIYKPAM